MRILLTCHRFPPDGIAGVERYTQTLAAELARAGHAVSIVTRRHEASSRIRLLRERLPEGTPLYRLTGGAFESEAFHDQHEALENLIVRVLAETAPEVVHVNHLLGLTPRIIEHAHRQATAVVMTFHDFYTACPLFHLRKRSGELCSGPDGGAECARTCFAGGTRDSAQRQRLRFAYFRRLMGLVDRFICPSHFVGRFFERWGLDGTRLHVIPNGAFIDPGAPVMESRPRCPHGCLRLAILGVVVHHKGAHRVLQALKIARLPAAELLLLGAVSDAAYARQLRAQAADIPGLKLRFYGQYAPAELPRLLSVVDCVITPSQVAETFSLTTREALLCGIPVLAARLGALPEAIVERENGFTFAHDKPEELASLLKGPVSDWRNLERLREGARSRRPVLIAEHAVAVQAVYAQACLGQSGQPAPKQAELQELEALYSLLRPQSTFAPEGDRTPACAA